MYKRQAEDRLGNVDELITKAAAYEETHDEPSLSEFLEEIMLVADIDNVENGDNRVPVSYTHLDVYKRQLWYCKPHSFPCDRSEYRTGSGYFFTL